MARKPDQARNLRAICIVVATRKKISEKTLYKGWLPVDDELDDTSEDEARLHLETVVAMVAVPKQAMTDAWSGLLAGLYALSVAAQSAHWRARGESFYSDHLLFKRIYDDIIEEIDTVAEKFMGIVGDETILDPNRLLNTSTSAVKQMITPGDLASSLLMAQKNFLGRLEGLSKILEATGQLTGGVENMLQAMIDKHESHVYLLTRRVAHDALKVCIRTT